MAEAGSTDPREIIDRSPMTRLQAHVIAMTLGLNALDGFDILSISFASPGIAAAWGVAPPALGIVLSMELIGMGLGSLLLGGFADRVGRRPTVLWCLVVMTIGMFMATTAADVVQLSVWRIVTGFGIGGMLSSINALAAEYSSRQRRHFCIAVMSLGYSLGGVIGGFVASRLLETFDWHSTFYLGATLTALFIPLFWLTVPESVHWLARKQPTGALERINETFRRMGRAPISVLPAVEAEDRARSSMDIFSPRLIGITLILTAAYFLHTITFYFLLKWAPSIVVQFGFNPASAGDVLTWASVGGAIGCASFAFLTLRLNLKGLTIFALALSGLGIAAFGNTPADLATMALLAAVAGVFCNAGVVGFYALMAHYFPTHARAFGTGFVISVGRGGAALSPILAGVLLGAELSLPLVGAILGSGSLLAMLLLIFLRREQD
jgi:benzoate transport